MSHMHSVSQYKDNFVDWYGCSSCLLIYIPTLNFEKKIRIYISVEWPETYTELFVTSLILPTTYAINIHQHLLLARHCV